MRFFVILSAVVIGISALVVLHSGGSEAAWPGDNGRILYRDQANGGIWVMDGNGSGRLQLTTGSDSSPSWSPDGTMIVFQRSATVYTMNADGSGQQPSASGQFPSWSEDGTRIIFSRSGKIMEMDAGGGNEETLTVDSDVTDSYPVYRPGHDEIALLRTELALGAGVSGFVATEVYLMDLGTGATTNVSNTLSYFDGPPDWAPDGSALTFRGIGGDIYTWDYSLPADPPQSILDGGSTVLSRPSFSPDGTKIAFTSGPPVVSGGGSSVQGTPAENQKVWVMDADGTNLDELAGAGDDPHEVAPDWGPVSSETPTPSPTAAPTPIVRDLVWGDNQCDDEANPIDSLITLRWDAGLAVLLNGCPPLNQHIEVLSITPAGLGEGDGDPQNWGNVDCDASITPVDSLKILRFDAGLAASQEQGCPPIGDGVQIQHAP